MGEMWWAFVTVAEGVEVRWDVSRWARSGTALWEARPRDGEVGVVYTDPAVARIQRTVIEAAAAAFQEEAR
jgi:hypothetical protein